jgi:outer membrane protein OmpA-like peptidoglycan-associated protein
VFSLAGCFRRNHIPGVRGKLAIVVAAVASMAAPVRADHIEFGAGLSQPGLNNVEQPWAVGPSWRLNYIHPLSSRFELLGGIGYTRYLNDTTSTSTLKFLLPNRLADQNWRLISADLGIQVNLMTEHSTTPYLRGLISSTFWNVQELGGGTVRATDASGGATAFSAEEVVVKGAAGLHYRFHRRVGLAVEAEAAYFTGAGADFSEATDDARSCAAATVFFELTYHWPRIPRVGPVPISQAPSLPAPPRETEPERTKTADSDGDGVEDIHDRCPMTPVEAAGWVDVYGCPVDTDADGVPDFADRCPRTVAGQHVDSTGCSVDSDGDGVVDSQDMCPDTEPALKTDSTGCPALPALSEKKVFRFNYASGGSELDADARNQLRLLAPSLKYNPDVKVLVMGYTDEIGPADANLALSQKRADRVKAYLVSLGVPASQMKAQGRGEAVFVASNATREGRAQNRRIEIAPTAKDPNPPHN